MMAARLGEYLVECVDAPPPHCPAFARGWLLELGLPDGAPWADGSLKSIMRRARDAGGVRKLAIEAAAGFGCEPVTSPRAGDVGLVIWPAGLRRQRFGFALRTSSGAWAMLGLKGIAIAPVRAVMIWRPV